MRISWYNNKIFIALRMATPDKTSSAPEVHPPVETTEEALKGPQKTAKKDAERLKTEVETRLQIAELQTETIADLRELPVEQLIELEDRHEGILLYAFTDFLADSTRIDLQHFETFYREPPSGTQLKINFHENVEAEAKIGAADVLPPSVRRITVLTDGDPTKKRTSERRLGLKGQNKSGNGFFDSAGYIPVFSGDQVIVGGEGSEGIDLPFDRKYRKEPAAGKALGELDYEKYRLERSKADEDYLKTLPPTARLSKYHKGASFSRAHREELGLEKKSTSHSKNLEQLLAKTPDLYTYAHRSREKYARATGIDIDESIMFGVIQIESGFRVDVLNRQGSGAGGLFQFIPSTWTTFLKENPWVYERMAKDPVWSRVDQMDWRFNPEIMMDAGYWLATKNMKVLYDHKNEIGLSEFKNTEFYKTGKVSTDDAWLLYLPHHDGAEGALRLLKYQSLREQGVAATTAEATVDLKAFQKHKHHFKNGKTIYDRDTFIADQHWKQLRAYAQQNVTFAKKYHSQLDAMGSERLAALAGGPGTWGWGQGLETQTSQAPTAYQTEAQLDRLAYDHKLSGKNLLIGSSSTLGYGSHVKGNVEVKAKEGWTIDKMLSELKKIPVEDLKHFSRIVIQGGMKNQPSYERSVKAMTEMVTYLRTNAPDVKIYVLEVTPWDSAHREGIEKFNKFLYEGKADGTLRIDGIVPLYAATNDGAGQLNPLFGKAGELHVSRYDRFAGVVADWITTSEPSS